MKIQSRFKDYYDHISHRYGADPDCVYIREPLKLSSIKWENRAHFFDDTLLRPSGSRRARERRKDDEIRALVDGYRIEFVIAGPRVTTFLHHYGHRRETIEVLGEKHAHLLMKDWRTDKPLYPTVAQGKKLEDLIRLVGAPVFMVRNGTLDERIPVLADLGFAAIVSPEQMWQDIYSTITNVLRTNPDKAPPVQVAEKYRIQEKGFDLKTSFRHPVNLKKLR